MYCTFCSDYVIFMEPF